MTADPQALSETLGVQVDTAPRTNLTDPKHALTA